MPDFNYKIINAEGKLIRGSISARSKSAAQKELSKEDETVLELLRDDTSALRRELTFSFGIGFKMVERISFFRNLSTMLGAGVPFTESIRIIAEQTKNKKTRAAIEGMATDVSNGKPLSDAMEVYPKLFSSYLVETVRVGESTGRLPGTLKRIADELERGYELTREVQGQLAYPAVVVAVMFGVLGVMMFYVLPTIAALFEEMGVDLPLPTRILLAIGTTLYAHPLLTVGIFSVIVIGFVAFVRTTEGKRMFHTLLLKLPLFGEIVREVNLTRFFRAVESLYLSGISLVRGVEIAGKTVRNVRFQEAAEAMHPLLLHGVPFTETLTPHEKLFPLQARRMLEMAERAGKMEEAFSHVNHHYEQALRHRTRTMASIIEPTVMVGIGLIVGALALSLFLPLYQSVYVI